MLVDTHCHVQFQAYNNDREEVVQRSLEKGIVLHVVGTQKDTSRAAVELAEKYENIFASIGTHPVHLHTTHVDEEESSFLSREEDFDWTFYTELAKSPKVTAVGECGLDLYHLPKDFSVEAVLEKQTRVFKDHMRFALEQNLPMVIHVREAHDQMIELMRAQPARPRGTIHCYTSTWTHAEQYFEMGFYLGFTGVITFPPRKSEPGRQEALLEVVKRMPLDRILVETDAPYLTPQAKRGQRNEPYLVEEVVKKIAELRGISYEDAASATTENALRLFDRMKINI